MYLRMLFRFSVSKHRRKCDMLILFDLDGTLTDSAPGITRSVQHAFDRMGYPKYSPEELTSFVGPPLNEEFMRFAGMSAADAEKAVGYFRERYETVGKFENSVYPGIPEMLQALCDRGLTLGIATSKPEHFARQIAVHYDLEKYFRFISAASMDETRTDKGTIIQEALRETGYDMHPDEAIMVGDRNYDILGAHKADIRAIGVTYGYGSAEELTAAGADALATSVEELQQMLLSEM